MKLSSTIASLGQIAAALASTIHIPDVLHHGPIQAESIAGLEEHIDDVKVTPGVNATTYDWWYFDVVSASTNQSLTVVFYNTGPAGFITGYDKGPLTASISGTYANGNIFNLNAPATGGATITVDDNDISGTWDGAGVSFYGKDITTDHAEYTLTFNSTSIGVFGNATFKSKAPPHLPCGGNTPGGKYTILPHVFWSNTVPDAVASVALSLPGGKLQFQDGVGYHDKNWGDGPFVAAVSSWYWGHARVGPYSVVWFDAWDSNVNEYASGYVVKDGKVLQGSCGEGGVQVRPWAGNQDRFAAKQGLGITFHSDKTTVKLNVTTDEVLVDIPVYVRAKGAVSGIVLGPDGNEDVHDGVAVFEQFNFR